MHETCVKHSAICIGMTLVHLLSAFFSVEPKTRAHTSALCIPGTSPAISHSANGGNVTSQQDLLILMSVVCPDASSMLLCWSGRVKLLKIDYNIAVNSNTIGT